MTLLGVRMLNGLIGILILVVVCEFGGRLFFKFSPISAIINKFRK